MRVDATRPVCLIGANLAFRRAALDAIGAFNPDVQRVGAAGGSTEDHELHLRLWAAGMHGIYEPALRVAAVVTPDRMRKRHHRSWHFRHGRHIARMKLPEMERSRASIVGVPAHLFRQAADDARAWTRHLVSGDAVTAFERETRLWFAAGFVVERCATQGQWLRQSQTSKGKGQRPQRDLDLRLEPKPLPSIPLTFDV